MNDIRDTSPADDACGCDDHAASAGADAAAPGSTPVTRRRVLAGAGAAVAGLIADAAVGTRFAFATDGATATKAPTLVSIFLKGGADGLSLVVPYTERGYWSTRPSIRLNGNQVVDIDGQFGLHMKMAPLAAAFSAGDLAAVHAVGSPDPSRSHFEAIGTMERGTPFDRTSTSGWLGRHLAARPTTGEGTTFRAVSVGDYVQLRIAGPSPILSLAQQPFRFSTRPVERTRVEAAFQGMYRSADGAIARTGSQCVEAVRTLATVGTGYVPENGAVYPSTSFGRQMMLVAQLVKAGVGLEAACLNLEGWDTHVNIGYPGNGRLAWLIADLAGALAAFHADLGTRMADVSVVVMSEFGRRVAENGGGGLDHGRGQCAFVMGAGVQGGRVHGRWPGLEPEQLDRGDLAATTDHRDVLWEVLARCGATDPAAVFPGFTPTPVGAVLTPATV